MVSKKALNRWFLIVVAILLMTPAMMSISSAGEDDIDQDISPSRSAGFQELFEVDITPDISEGEVDLGEDVTVTITGRELPDGSQVEIDGDKYINQGMNDRPVPAKINVTNVLWDGTPWYAEYDDSVWQRNDTNEKYFRRVSPHEVKLTIWSEIPDDDGYQFPAGCDVSFNLYVGNKTQDDDGRWVNRYLESEEYTYEVGGAFPYKPADYDDPENPDDDLFEENIDIIQEPENPNVRDDVEVTINSESDVNISWATLHIEAVYPDDEIEYYQLLASDFDPINGEWPTPGAIVTILGEDWHTVPDTEINYHLAVRDPHGNEVVSEEYSYYVGSIGTWENSNFGLDIRLRTDPEVTEVDATVSRTTSVEVTIMSRNENVPIENAYLFYSLSNKEGEVSQEGQWQLDQESPTVWSTDIPAQQREVQVNFYVRAWDIAENMIESPEYTYSVEEKTHDIIDEPGRTYFYVRVYDAEIDLYVPEVKVAIGNHTWETTTYTNPSGMCYPNVTGEETLQLVSIGEPYWIEVYYPHQIDNETEEMVRLEYTPEDPEDQNETEIIYDEGNLVVTRVNDTLEFEYNSPPEPPEFADIYEGYNLYTMASVFILVVMVAPVAWKLYRLTEEGKHERSLVK